MQPYTMVLIAFVCGSLPFSVWVGKYLEKKDIRQFGDGNPGAMNVFRGGSKLAGLLALILDISKAAVPVGLAFFTLGIRGVPMALIATAPVLGHVFSPFLHFRGGKALAPSLGVWIGISIWQLSLPALAGVLIGAALFTPMGWAVMLAMASILVVILIWLPTPLFLVIWFAQTLILAWTHREDLRQGIHARPWLGKLLARARGNNF
jgi:glycerol-3-phosphate acyltransferase PlsY